MPVGDAIEHADVDLAAGGLGADGTTRDLGEADVAVGGLGRDRGVRLVDGDSAIGRVHAKLADNLADPGVAVAVLAHRAAADASRLHSAGARAELGVVCTSVHDDVAPAGAKLCLSLIHI